jgi:hypothetical protein
MPLPVVIMPLVLKLGPAVIAGITGLIGIFFATGKNNKTAKYIERMRARTALIIVFVVVGTVVGLFLANKLFFNRPAAVVERVETTPEIVIEPETAGPEIPAADSAGPVKKDGFLHRAGGFFAGIGGAVSAFFRQAGGAIKTFFVKAGAFFTGTFGRLFGFVNGSAGQARGVTAAKFGKCAALQALRLPAF